MQIPVLGLPWDDEDQRFFREAGGRILDSGTLTVGPTVMEFEGSFQAQARSGRRGAAKDERIQLRHFSGIPEKELS